MRLDRPASYGTCREIRETTCVGGGGLPSTGISCRHRSSQRRASSSWTTGPIKPTCTWSLRADPKRKSNGPADTSPAFGSAFVLAPPNCSLGGGSSSIESSMVIVCVRSWVVRFRIVRILPSCRFNIALLLFLRLERQLFQFGVQSAKVVVDLVFEFRRFFKR